MFYNYEAGGWVKLIRNKLSAAIGVYRLSGTQEIISVKQDDGSFSNQKTLHTGIGAGIQANPHKDISFRFSGAFSKHRFVDYTEKGVSYNDNEMNNAPQWLYNTECWYTPAYIKGFRLGLERQHMDSYYTLPQNTACYKGYHVLNCRSGYRFNGVELNCLNVTDNYYSYIMGYSYQLAEPCTLNMGLTIDVLNNNK